MVVYHMDMVIPNIDMRYGLMIWEMIVSIQSSPISIWDILSPWPHRDALADHPRVARARQVVAAQAEFQSKL
jgi:hypothetical protein